MDDFKKDTKKIQIKKNIPDLLSKDPQISKSMLESHPRVTFLNSFFFFLLKHKKQK